MDLKQLHNQILGLYKTSLFPKVNEFFSNEKNTAEEKSGGEFSNTLVTKADLVLNKILTDNLPKFLPGANVISEESSDSTFSKYTFIIDPIDGTHTFARNLDDFGISITLCEGGEVKYCIIFYPNCKTKYYFSIKDEGVFDDLGNKITPRKYFSFKPTIVCAPFSRKIGRSLIDFTKDKMISFKAYGSVVFDLYTLLRGGTDILVIDHLNIWDVVSVAFIAKESGFIVKWISDEVKIDNDSNIMNTKYTLLLYKPDFEKLLLEDLLKVIRTNF